MALGQLPSEATGPAALERAVVAVWSDVLGTEVGVTDEFGSLCADLPGAVRVVALLNQLLGTDLSVMRLAAAGTPHQLAASLHAEGVTAPRLGTTPPSRGDNARQHFWETTYRFANPNQPQRFNTAGWVDSGSLTSLPEPHMREWVLATVSRVRELSPRRVLDLGCGAGLILFRLAPWCDRYVGVDFSEEAIRQVRRALVAHPTPGPVELFVADAVRGTELATGTYDVVLLNSVVQYFPDLMYLTIVLAGAVRRTADGGSVFLGDLRHRDLHHAMHVSAAARADDTPVEQVRLAVEHAMSADAPLLVAPADLPRLASTIDAGLTVTPLVRRGVHPTEMNRFRYDALLTVDNRPLPRAAREVRWRPEAPDPLPRLLGSAGETLVLRTVPDARTVAAVRLAAAVATAPPDTTIGELRRGLGTIAAVDPEQAWVLGHDAGFGVAIAPGERPGHVDIAFWRGQDDRAAARLLAMPCARHRPMFDAQDGST